MKAGIFECLDESQSHLETCLAHEVVDGIRGILVGSLSRN